MRTLIVSLLFLSLSMMQDASAASIILGGGGGEFNIKTKTFQDSRFTNTVRQKYDFSCGSAALATLLKFHYGVNVDERTVIQQMYDAGDQEKISREGFSMLDMKSYLASLGLRADGFKESLNKLQQVGIPAIVLINHNGYLHFVVVKGVTKDKVVIADPSLGSRIQDRKVFESQWNNILFVINDRMDIGRKNFNKPHNWAVRTKGRFNHERMVSNLELGRMSLESIVPPGYYY